LRLARHRLGPRARLVAAEAQHLPFQSMRFDAALVLDSFASLPEPGAILGELGQVLRPGARLGFTAEVGQPLNAIERRGFARTTIPPIQTATAWLTLLRRAGYVPVAIRNRTRAAAVGAERVAGSVARHQAALARELGAAAADDLLVTLATWARLFAEQRVAEVEVVARRLPSGSMAAPRGGRRPTAPALLRQRRGIAYRPSIS
jgi:SAM-dependent methyltransferase